ncbi:hypothetical protein [Listeria valentina]|uniref:hypothetical protein n=1 Tax=Listeria valentina TaxID=2705293 RepID=UPI0031B5A937
MATKKVFTDEEYFRLSEIVYQDKTLNAKKFDISLENGSKRSWKVVAKLNDRPTNTQAFAVVPQEKGKDGKLHYNYDNMVFTYRGSKEIWDIIRTDTINVFAGSKARTSLDRKSKNAFQVSKDWTDTVLKKYKPSNPTSSGHSLGAGLSHYNSVIHDFSATTFAGPNVYRLLPEKYQKKVREGYYDKSIVDYTHNDDMIGNYEQMGAPLIGSQYVAKRNTVDVGLKGVFGAIPGHYNETFEGCFSADGAMELKIDTEGIIRVAQDIDRVLHELQQAKSDLEHIEEDHKKKSQKIRNKLDDRTGLGGRYSELTSWNVDDVLTELSTRYQNGTYCYYDPEEFERYYQKNLATQKQLKAFQAELIEAAKTFREKDTQLGNWIAANSKGW